MRQPTDCERLRHEYAEQFHADPQHTPREFIQWLIAELIATRRKIEADTNRAEIANYIESRIAEGDAA